MEQFSDIRGRELRTVSGCPVSFCCADQGKIHTLALEADILQVCTTSFITETRARFAEAGRQLPHAATSNLFVWNVSMTSATQGTLHWELPLLQQKERRKLYLPCCT